MQADAKMISKLFFKLLPVQILLVAISGFNSIIDGAMANNFIDPKALTVIGLYLPFVKIIETINAVLLGGSQILCGRFLGKNQIERTRSVFSVDMFVVTSLGLLMSILCIVFPGFFSDILGADATTHDDLVKYIIGISIGLIPQMLASQLTAFLQMEQQQKRTYAGIILMMVSNATLDYLFIKVFSWGMFGLGLATAISYWILFAFQGTFYLTSKAVIKFSMKLIQWSDIGPIIKIGVPGAIVSLCLSIRGVLLNKILLSTGGNDAVGALSALNTFGCVLYAPTAGLAAATRLLISIYMGEEDKTSMKLVLRTALTRGVLMVTFVGGLVAALSVPMTYIFYKDPTSTAFYLTKWIFRIFPLTMPLSAVCITFINYYQSVGRMKIVNVLSVFDGILGVGGAAIAMSPFGTVAVWWAHVIGGLINTSVILVYSIIVNKRFPKNLEELATIPKDFGVPDEDRLDISIHSNDDVVNTSQQIIDFCQGKGIDYKKSYYAGLCLEEMATNIVKHGFTDKKKHSVDVRVIYGTDGLMLRIKDDCLNFNPQEKLELIDPEDKTHNIGIRMVSNIAKDMSYHSVLGLNVLTVSF